MSKILCAFLLALLTAQTTRDIEGCLTYTNSSKSACCACDQSNCYYLSGGSCLRSADPNCRQVDSAGRCTSCQLGYLVTDAGACVPVPNIPNCAVYNQDNRTSSCISCFSGYQLVNNACVSAVADCVEYATGGLCSRCKDGCKLTATKGCQPEIANCATYLDATRCLICQSGFGLSAARDRCLNSVANCMYYASSGVCLVCNQYYYLSGDQKACLPSISNCLQLQVNSGSGAAVTCAKCASGYQVSSSGLSCDLAFSLPNCLRVNSLTKCCDLCANNMFWFAKAGACVAVISGCQDYALGSGSGKVVCASCCAGYSLSADGLACSQVSGCGAGQSLCARTNRCVSVPSCCASDDGCGTCKSFKPNTGWCLATGSCYSVPAACPDNHDCLTGKCVCQPGTVWSDSLAKCVSLVPCCDRLDASGQCLAFKTGTNWCSATKACYNVPASCPNPWNHDCATGKCVCPQDQTWCATKGMCVKTLFCCQKSDDCGNCLQFQPGLGFCDKTQLCYSTPKECPSNHDCATGYCLCPSGQVWNPLLKKCVQVPECCLNYDAWGNCFAFKPNTGWCRETSQCYFIPLACPLNHNCKTGECVCPTGWSWCPNRSTCVLVPVCCNTYDACGNCLSLKDGYSVCAATKSCVQIPANCKNNNDGCGNCTCPDQQTWCDAQSKCFSKPLNCARADNCGNCLACSGIYILINGQCFLPANIPHCLVYSLDRQTCATCELYYSLMNNGLACQTTNCANYSTGTNLCIQCLSNFELVGNEKVCLPSIPGCAQYANFIYGNLSLTCLCSSPQTWCSAQSRCFAKPLNCAIADNCGNCSTCSGVYVLINGQCYLPANIPHCTDYNVDKQTCVRCELYYSLINNGLACQTTNCANYSTQTNLCIQCLSNFELVGNEKVCLPSIPGCVQYANFIYGNLAFTCLCASPQTWCPAQSRCFAKPLNCAIADNCGNCLTCSGVYVLINGQCFLPANIPHCTDYSADKQTCIKCELYYSLINNGLACQTTNCANYSTGINLCVQCLPNFELVGTQKVCLPSIPGCNQYAVFTYGDLALTCLCANPQTWCSAQSKCFAKPLNCAIADNCGNCLTCSGVYILINGQCFLPANIPHCLVYSLDRQTCATCELYYSLMNNGLACQTTNCANYSTGTNLCVQCLSNFELVGNEKVCLPSIPGCVQYANFIYGNLALTCLCASPQTWCPAQSRCFAKPLNCAIADNCGNCSTCSGVYVLINGQCVLPANIPHCTDYSVDKQTCVRCELYYSLINNGSACQTTNCSNYSFFTNICLQCMTNFMLVGTEKVCLPSIPSCIQYADFKYGDLVLTCLCSSPQTWCPSQNKCFTPPANCARDDGCGNCLNCFANYILINNKCFSPVSIPHCLDYSPDQQSCVNCQLYYSLANNGLACQTTNCLNYSNQLNLCTQCLSGFVLVGNEQVCLPGVRECSAYAAFNYGDLTLVCTACNFPYYIDSFNNKCTINNCLEYQDNPSALTCKTCLVQELRSPDQKICFPAIEKCTDYDVTNANYACKNCEIGYKLSDAGSLCIIGTYLLGGYAAGAGGGAGSFNSQFFFVTQTASGGFQLQWGQSDSSSQWSLWYLTSYDGVFYTVRLQVSINGGRQTPIYLANSGSGTSLQNYFLLADNIKWVLENGLSRTGDKNAWFIKAYQSGLYLGYDGKLSATPTPFYLV